MRPDGVYRTGVLSPMVGFQPNVDVPAVAASFAMGPPSGMLAGFGAPGPFKRLGMRIRAARARRQAQRFMLNGLAAPLAPAITEARIVAPQMAQQIKALMTMAPAAGGPRAALEALAMRRFNTYYRAG